MNIKTKEEILEQTYMSAEDLKILIPSMGINNCTNFIKETIKEMQDKNYFIPRTKKYLALTKLVKKKLGI